MKRATLLSGVDFVVGLKPALMEHEGRTFEIPDRFVTYREDNGEPLGVVGSRYRVVQHTETLELVADSLSNVTKDFTVSHNIENARIYSRFELKDFSLFKESNEETRLAVDLLSSYDGDRSVLWSMSAWRLICTNGMMGFVKEMVIKKRHCKGVVLETFLENIPEIIKLYEVNYIKLYKGLVSQPVIDTDTLKKSLTTKLIKQARELYPLEYKLSKRDDAWTQYQSFTRAVSHSKDIQENRRIEISKTLSQLFMSQFAIA